MVLFIVPNFTKAQTNFVVESWNGIKEKAKNENKLIFVDLYLQVARHAQKWIK